MNDDLRKIVEEVQKTVAEAVALKERFQSNVRAGYVIRKEDPPKEEKDKNAKP